MRVPIEWLKELVSFRAGPDQLAQMLTMAGLETVVLPDDILEVDILPNRADAWSLRGIAREVSALTKFKVKNSKSRLKESFKRISVKVEVRDRDLCPRYMARVIERVKVGESPEWLKKRLEQAGMRPVNNVVDVTNYMLHEMGQPMHAFDAALIKEQHIIVRRANPEEKVTTLDGKERVLDPETAVIADPEKVIAVGGVMGAANTEVGITATTIILESACFNPVSIHKTSKKLKLRTESSVRFEHGVDWEVVEEALDRGAAMIAELGRGEVLKGKADVKVKDRKPQIVELRPERVNKILGTEIPAGDMGNILKRLGFSVRKADGRKLKVGIPLYRANDVEREIDLIEEIARLWGFGRIPTTMPDTAFPGKQIDRGDNLRNKVREILVGCGLNEVQTYSMLGPKDFEMTGLPVVKAVRIANPLNIEESILRTDLLPGLLKAMLYNQNRQAENVLIFEIGKVFLPSKEKLPVEKWRVGAALTGSPFMSAMDKGTVDYFYLKGILDNLFCGLGIEMPKLAQRENFLVQPGKAATLEGMGVLGELHPDIQRNYGFARPVFFFEIDLEDLLPAEVRYRPLPKFPSVARDISMFIPAGLENQAVIETIKKTGGELVEAVFPFDKYKDSVAYRIIYRHPEHTLTEEEVNKLHQKVVQALASELTVKIR